MGNLTVYLQSVFASICPPDWQVRPEVAVLPPEIVAVLGYAPRADVLLERRDGSRRLWIEFEISRADPVANHAKFATAQLFQPLPTTDSFVAMVSPHVDRGRRNLAAATIGVMRRLGMDAFQTVLFPNYEPATIKWLNHLDLASLPAEGLTIRTELDRALLVAEPALRTDGHRIHFVGDVLDVLLNVRQWNAELATPDGQRAWGRRTVRYFVADPRTQRFAPAKFCAYLVLRDRQISDLQAAMMTIATYVTLDGVDSRFDGHRAQTHLTKNLAMRPHELSMLPTLQSAWSTWLTDQQDWITVHPAGPTILLAPTWF
jgi:hypothetical protein